MAKSNKHRALHEKAGVPAPPTVSVVAAREIQKFRRKAIDVEALYAGILARDISALSRGITLIESQQAAHLGLAHQLIDLCLPHANASVRLGITGVPGVGKSTFIEAFGKHLTGLGKRVAVLAVDPSSALSHGSILGDKTRMEALVTDKNAYIRPSASGDSLGGVARKTREAIVLCEAAGYDTIIIETVGVGQSETAVHSMVDFFLLLKLAGAGDELQGIKRGIMEMADAIVINKADGDNVKKARLAKTEFNRALHLFPPKASGWTPKVSTCSALTQEGIAEVWDLIAAYLTLVKDSQFFEEKRKQQNHYWMLETIDEALKAKFYRDAQVMPLLESTKKAVQNSELSPFAAAHLLLDSYFGKKD